MVSECRSLWDDLRILDLEIRLVAEEDIRLPFFRENALRAALGTSFRTTVCIYSKHYPCQECHLQQICAYFQLFSASRGNMPAGNSSPPYLSFFAPSTPTHVKAGTSVTVYLRLMGTAVSYYPYFYFCLENMSRTGIGLRNENGKRGRFVVDRIYSLSPGGQKNVIFSRNASIRLENVHPLPLGDYIDFLEVQTLTVRTLSPLRIKHLNRLTDDLEFHVLFRSVLRRMTSLYYWTTGRYPVLDAARLLEKAATIRRVCSSLRWFDYRRYSTTQQMDMKLGGVVGKVRYQGDLTDLYPYIKAGEVLGVGKSLSFGFGRYEVSIEEEGQSD